MAKAKKAEKPAEKKSSKKLVRCESCSGSGLVNDRKDLCSDCAGSGLN